MPYPWTDDDLLFALVRAAHLEPPQRIADDLLSAADRPDEGRHLLMTGCCGGPPPGTTGLPRQAPDLTGILGGTWRDLTARVESFMSTAAQSAVGAVPLLFAHADFAKFAAYLEQAGADPRLSTVQTAFTRHAGAGYHYPARWPPGGRYPCWCGSHRKYQRCCG